MQKHTILRKRVNQYRTMETRFVLFPDHLPVRDLEYVAHNQGRTTIFEKHVDVFTFDSISFITESVNKISNGSFIHCLGYRMKERSMTVLILRKK